MKLKVMYTDILGKLPTCGDEELCTFGLVPRPLNIKSIGSCNCVNASLQHCTLGMRRSQRSPLPLMYTWYGKEPEVSSPLVYTWHGKEPEVPSPLMYAWHGKELEVPTPLMYTWHGKKPEVPSPLMHTWHGKEPLLLDVHLAWEGAGGPLPLDVHLAWEGAGGPLPFDVHLAWEALPRSSTWAGWDHGSPPTGGCVCV